MKNLTTNSLGDVTRDQRQRSNPRPSRVPQFPFVAIVGQDEMKLGLILSVIDPSIGGVLIMGHRGTGKSTAVRGLADLLPEIWIVRDCPFCCDPADERAACESCLARLAQGEKLERKRSRIPVVDLPLGATEDRVCGAIDIQRALAEGVKSFEPGLLARANRGFLYIDEVNLLEDHLVDLLLDVAVTGRNKVEREGISVEHPARFVLVGSGNPEEGELRPQLLDRFGLHVEVRTEGDLDERVQIVERREAYDRDPEGFCVNLEAAQAQLRQRIVKAQKAASSVEVDRLLLRKVAQLCADLQVDGHRGEITITRAGRALAAFEGRKKVSAQDVKRVSPMALRHRMRRDPLEETGSTERIERALSRSFPEAQPDRQENGRSEGEAGGRGQNEKTRRELGAGQRNDRGRLTSASGGDDSGFFAADLPVLDENKTMLPELPLRRQSRESNKHSPKKSSRRPRESGQHNRNHLGGRYVRATATNKAGARLAVDATLRAIAEARVRSLDVSSQQLLSGDVLRFKELSHKSGRLFVFAVDTSGSMAWHRIGQAKAAVIRLLKQSYLRRDSVAVISFRGDSAEVLLPPSRSILRARRALTALRVGGGTPLSAGLACALKLASGARSSSGEVSVLLFTDGHANVALSSTQTAGRVERQIKIKEELAALGAGFKKAAVRVVVVDTKSGFASHREAETLAERLGAAYTCLPSEGQF